MGLMWVNPLGQTGFRFAYISGIAMLISQGGWQEKCFLLFMEYFIKRIIVGKDTSILFLLDNHQSLDLAKEIGAVLLFSPRHNTHRLNPLYGSSASVSWLRRIHPEKNCDNFRQPLHSETVAVKCIHTKEYEVCIFGRLTHTWLLRRIHSLLLWLTVHLTKIEALKILDSEILTLQLEIRCQ
jgi:hypothetical protein